MYCTQCGFELRSADQFCSQCGHRTAVKTAPAGGPLPLMLDKHNKKIAGVCAGFARYCSVDVTLVRVLWLVIAFCGGIGFLAYLVGWIIIPNDHGYQMQPVATREAQTS
jgi:phage shock protein C